MYYYIMPGIFVRFLRLVKSSFFYNCIRYISILGIILSVVVISKADVQEVYGSIQGKITDSETGTPLSSAKVVINNIVSKTEQDGEFFINEISPGNHLLSVSRMGYGTLRKEVRVEKGQTTKLDISLVSKAIALGKVTVIAPRTKSTSAGLLESRRKAQSISDGISAVEMKRTPDSDAASALKRVTGLSVVGGKYVYIRGLGERYSKAMLNHSTLPSPEPDKRVVPFDIFPAGLLDNMVIMKTYTPELPSDFAGGFIHLTTKEFPVEPTLKFSISSSFNTQTTFEDIKTYEGGELDFLGIDDGTRNIPDILEKSGEEQNIVPGGRFGGGFSPEELERFGEAFPNIWEPYEKTAPPNLSFSISLGNQQKVFDRPLGYIASFTYKNGYDFHKEKRNYYIVGANNKLEKRHEIDDFRVSNHQILLGGLFNTSYRLSAEQKISFNTIYTRNTDDEVRRYIEFPNRDHNLDERATLLRWVSRSLLSTQISGKRHSIFDSEIDWRANYSLAKRNEPDTREVLYESKIDQNNFRLADESQSGSRFFSNLVDNNYDVGLDIKLPIRQGASSFVGEIKFGSNFIYKDRKVDSRRFRFKPQDFMDVNIYQEPEEIFSPGNIGPNGFQLEEDTRATDNYKAEQTLLAGYSTVDMLLVSKLRMIVGARLEYSNQEVTTFELFNPDNVPVVGQIETVDVLPTLNLVYKLTEDMNLRSSISQTLSRPDFRELSEFEFTDIGGHAVVGNPELERSLTQNYDLRWEWYPRTEEVLAISVFYKNFNKPIEEIILPATEPATSWQNTKGAFNLGLELEVRKKLDFLPSVLSNFSISSNLALIESEIELGERGIETFKKRPLQGQSPYIANLTLAYDSPKWGTNANLLYNVFGERISKAGYSGTPDIYEEPFHQLDFVFSQSLWNNINAKLSCKNLLNPKVKFTQGDSIQRAYRKGRSFSLNLSYDVDFEKY